MYKKITVAILAGGKSSRMGKDKASLEYQGKTFLEHLVEEFQSADELIISNRWLSLSEPLITQNIKMVHDRTPNKGPLEGLRSVLETATKDYVFVCATDMPFVKKEIPEYLSDFFSTDYDAYVPTIDGKTEPLCAVYKKSILPFVQKQLGEEDLKLSHLFEKVRTKFIPIEKSSLKRKMFFNVNTPEDFYSLQKPFIFCVGGIKNSGKTRLLCNLLEAMKERNCQCAVIKHDGHDCFSDKEGTDTFLFSKKGASSTAVFSDSRFMLSSNSKTDENLLIEKIKELNANLDYIIIEGLKDSSFPKVEVLREGVSEKSLCSAPLICIASDFEYTANKQIPNLKSDDADKILCEIENYFRSKI